MQRGEKEKLSGGNTVDDVYWHEENSGNKSQLVGQKRLNGLPLYDMLGNVYEWCIGTYLVGYYSQNPKQGPVTKGVSSERTRRWGSANSEVSYQCADDRTPWDKDSYRDEYTCFRLALPLQNEPPKRNTSAPTTGSRIILLQWMGGPRGAHTPQTSKG